MRLVSTIAASRQLAGIIAVLLPVPARFTDFVNGGFELGTLDGWTVTTIGSHSGGSPTVATIDIDGGGPLGATSAVRTADGSINGQPAGPQFTQQFGLFAGEPVTVELDWRVDSAGTNSDGSTIAIVANDAVIAAHSVGPTMATTTYTGHLSAIFTPPTSGSYALGFRVTRTFTSAGSGVVTFVDNVRLTQPPLCLGDLNNDGRVDDADFVIFLAAYNLLDCADPAMPPGCPSDLDQNSVVDDRDFVAFAAAYNQLECG